MLACVCGQMYEDTVSVHDPSSLACTCRFHFHTSFLPHRLQCLLLWMSFHISVWHNHDSALQTHFPYCKEHNSHIFRKALRLLLLCHFKPSGQCIQRIKEIINILKLATRGDLVFVNYLMGQILISYQAKEWMSHSIITQPTQILSNYFFIKI